MYLEKGVNMFKSINIWSNLSLSEVKDKINLKDYYPPNYGTFRIMLKEAVKEFKQKNPDNVTKCVHTWFEFKGEKAVGKDGKQLNMDIVMFHNCGILNGKLVQPKKILLYTGGVHGVEAFASSAVLLYLLKNINCMELQENSVIIFVPVVDPYGFAHIRRCNENGVDLNRNLIIGDEHENLRTRGEDIRDHYKKKAERHTSFRDTFMNMFKPKPDTPELEQDPMKWYVLFAHVLNPKISRLYYGMLSLLVLALYLKFGPRGKDAARGQYWDPTGPFFGGEK